MKMRGSTLFIAGALLACTRGIKFQISNNARGEIWVGIQGNYGHPHLEHGGFKLGQGQEKTVNAPDNWAGRFWSRTRCDDVSYHCQTGDCGNRVQCNGAGGNPPATLVEIILKGTDETDFYDISLVDGFNVKAAIEPQGAQGDGGQYNCKRAGCDANINKECPKELQLKNHQDQVVGCKSACLAFDTDAA